MGYWLVDCHPGSGRWRSASIDLVDELVWHKMASQEIIIICILYLIVCPYCVQKLSKLVDECWRYSKPNQCHFWVWSSVCLYWAQVHRCLSFFHGNDSQVRSTRTKALIIRRVLISACVVHSLSIPHPARDEYYWHTDPPPFCKMAAVTWPETEVVQKRRFIATHMLYRNKPPI